MKRARAGGGSPMAKQKNVFDVFFLFLINLAVNGRYDPLLGQVNYGLAKRVTARLDKKVKEIQRSTDRENPKTKQKIEISSCSFRELFFSQQG